MANTADQSCSLKALLGSNMTSWYRLKNAAGILTDRGMLLKLIAFFAEAKGVDLCAAPPPPAAIARTVTVRVLPRKEAVVPSSFIVIHQTDWSDGAVKLQMKTELAKPKTDNVDSRSSVGQSGDEQDQDPQISADAEEDQDPQYEPADDPDVKFELQPRRRTKKAHRGRAQRPTPRFRRSMNVQDDHSRALDGIVWREAVLRGRQMPPDDVRLMFGESGEGVSPSLIPWDDPPPVREYPSEAPILAQIGCALCPRLGFSSRVEIISHLWLRHPETRERYPAQFICSKQYYEHAHCSLCFHVGTVAPAGKRCKLAPHVASAHVACQRASELAPHVCDVCHAEFGSQAEHDGHVAAAHVQHVPRRFTCPVCAAAVNGQQGYIRHLRIHYTEFKYSCNLCPNFRSRQPETMAAHGAMHKRRFLRCGLCQFRTRTYRTAADHLRVHLQLPLHVCPTCGYRAYSSSRYFNHVDTHGGRRHRCDICSAEFTTMLKKAHHKITAHRRPASLTCERCGLVFISQYRLRRHQMLHTGLKPFGCPLCGKRLSSRQSLTNHSRICPEGDDAFRPAAVVEVTTT